MNAFNYGISIQEAIDDMCEASGEPEQVEVRKLAEALLGNGARLTAFKEESGLGQDVEINAGQAANALFAICEYPVTDDLEGYSLESHIVATGQQSHGDYIEVPVKHFRIPRPVLGELLELVDVSPIPKDWIKDTESSSQRILSNQKEDTRPVSVEREEGKRIIPIKTPKKRDNWFDVISDAVQKFEGAHNHTPSKSQLWLWLADNPPTEFSVKYDKREKALITPDGTLSRDNFNKRYGGYYPSNK